MSRLLRCPSCQAYTLAPSCSTCQVENRRPGPARFNPEDPYGEYRRALKRREREA